MRACRLLLLFFALAIPGCGGAPAVIFDEPPAVPPFAAVSRVDREPPVSGAMAAGVRGDFVLANDHLVVVLAAPSPAGDGAYAAGSLIDAAPGDGVDALAAFEPMAIGGSLRPVIRVLETRVVDGTHAEAIARGGFAGRDSIDLEHAFRLAAGERFVDITSRVVNRSSRPVEIEPGDRIAWGRAEPLLERGGGPERLLRWLAGAGEGSAYLWAADVDHRVEVAEPGVTLLSAGARVLAPGDTLEYRRRWVVAHGSAAEATRVIPSLVPRGARVAVEVRDSSHLPLHGVLVEARDSSGTLLTRGETNQAGLTLLLVPPGPLTVEALSPERGRRRSSRLAVGVDGEERVRLDLPEPARLRLHAIDEAGAPCPAEWRVRGVGGTPDPVLGPRYRTSGAGIGLFCASGDTAVRLPAGRYRVAALAGLDREHDEGEIDLAAGGAHELRFTVPAIPLPGGWVAVDLHAHTTAAPGCLVSAADRAVQQRAHGAAWSGTTDPVPGSPDGGTPPFPARSLAGRESIAGPHRVAWFTGAARIPPGIPGVPPTGLAGLMGAVRSAAPQALLVLSYSCAEPLDTLSIPSVEDLAAADAWEIWSGARHRRWERDWKRWMEALASGTRVVALGAGGAMDLPSLEDGGPVTYVRLPDGAPPPGGIDDLLAGLRAGRCVVSNGPFIDLTVGDAGPGDVLKTRPGPVEVRIRVVAPRRIDVRRVVLVVNGLEHAAYMVRGNARSVRFDETVEVPLTRPGFVLVRVEGGETPGEGGAAEPDGRDARPLAFTNPVWVEISPGPR